MSERLELGDVVRTTLKTLWFVDEVGGYELVRAKCVRASHPATPYRFGHRTTLGRQVTPPTMVIARNVVDFEHACAIVALLS